MNTSNNHQLKPLGVLNCTYHFWALTNHHHKPTPQPYTLGRSVNSFELGPGQEWHRTDGWTKDMLPEGWRPMLLGECGTFEILESGCWNTYSGQNHIPARAIHPHQRTRRPLPFPGWNPHNGGACPVDGGTMVDVRFTDEVVSNERASFWSKGCGVNNWTGVYLENTKLKDDSKIIAWRYAAPEPPKAEPPKPDMVDPYAELKAAHAAGKKIQFKCIDGSWNLLEYPAWQYPSTEYRIAPEPAEPTIEAIPENIPPGTAVRSDSVWSTVVAVWPDGFTSIASILGGTEPRLCFRSFDECCDDGLKINLPTDRDANAFPTIWRKLVKKGEGK